MNTPPSGFAQYPRPQGLPSSVRAMPPGLHTEAIGEAWQLFQKQSSTWAVASLICIVVYLAVYIPNLFLTNYLEYGKFGIFPAPGSVPSGAGFLESFVLGLIPMAILTGFGGSMFLMALKQMRGQPIAVGDVFSAFGKVPQLMVAYICSIILTMIGFVLCIIPAFWVMGAFSLTPFAILDLNQGPFEALATSFRACGSAGSGFSMFGLLFLLGLIFWVGVIPCGLGLLVTVPLYSIALSIHYYYYFPEAFGPANAPVY
jgi:uncharacterized membrane protein YwzB